MENKIGIGVLSVWMILWNFSCEISEETDTEGELLELDSSLVNFEFSHRRDGLRMAQSMRSQKAQQLVEKEFEIEMEVKSIDDATAVIQRTTVELGGIVQTSKSKNIENSRCKYTYLKLIGPSESSEHLVENIKELAQPLRSIIVYQRDISDELAEIEAQLKSERGIESRYAKLRKQADSIEDIIKIEAQLLSTQTIIERLTSNRDKISRRSYQSVIELSMYQGCGKPAKGADDKSSIGVLKSAFSKGADAIMYVITGIIVSLMGGAPVIVVIVIALTTYRRTRSGRNRAKRGEHPSRPR